MGDLSWAPRAREEGGHFGAAPHLHTLDLLHTLPASFMAAASSVPIFVTSQPA